MKKDLIKEKRSILHAVLDFLKSKWFVIVVGGILILYCISMLVPVLWGFITTFKDYFDLRRNPVGFPDPWTLQNYIDSITHLQIRIIEGNGFRYVGMDLMLFNSLFYALVVAFLTTLVPCVAGYLCAKYTYRFSSIIYSIVIVTMILPIVGSLPSEIQMLQNLGLYDSFFGVFIMKTNFLGMYFLIAYATFKSVPWDYAESAFIDGASHLTVMFKIMFPLIGSAFLSMYILNFITYWNDYSTPMIYLPSHPTIAYSLYYLKFVAGGGEIQFNMPTYQLTNSFLLTAPLIVIFIIFQKRLMNNVTVGGIKG